MTDRRTRRAAHALVLAAMAGVTLGLLPASAVGQSQEHPVVVSDNPADWTPHVIDGRVNAVLQVGDTVFAGGTFTQVKDADSADIIDQPYLMAFDADTGVIDTRFAPQLNGRVEALAATCRRPVALRRRRLHQSRHHQPGPSGQDRPAAGPGQQVVQGLSQRPGPRARRAR